MKAALRFGVLIGFLTVVSLLLQIAWFEFGEGENFFPTNKLPLAFGAGTIVGFAFELLRGAWKKPF